MVCSAIKNAKKTDTNLPADTMANNTKRVDTRIMAIVYTNILTCNVTACDAISNNTSEVASNSRKADANITVRALGNAVACNPVVSDVGIINANITVIVIANAVASNISMISGARKTNANITAIVYDNVKVNIGWKTHIHAIMTINNINLTTTANQMITQKYISI